MWFKSGYWHIGTENNLGSINSWWISSKLYENSECPTESNIEWETLNHTTSEWIELSEIYLYCLGIISVLFFKISIKVGSVLLSYHKICRSLL